MKDLVLLADEVALLKFVATQEAVNRTGPTLSHEITCDFFCQVGLAELDGEQIRLTQVGQRVANTLLCAGVSTTALISPCVLRVLGPQVAGSASEQQ